jgi:predicted nucleic acid-binding protein
MNGYVVDASVAAKWFFEEAHTRESLRLLAPAFRLAAPDFLLAELDNLVWKRVRRKELSLAEGRKVRAAVRRMPIQLHPFQPLLDPAYEIAAGAGCTVYDSLYVALALLLESPLVTADRGLYEAIHAGPLAKHAVWVEDTPA